jgi:hypothetical protein
MIKIKKYIDRVWVGIPDEEGLNLSYPYYNAIIKEFLEEKEREEQWVTSETSKSIRKWMKQLEDGK